MRAYIAATEERRVDLDWDTAERVAQFGNGIPQAVSVAGSATPLATEIARTPAAVKAAKKKPPTSGGLQKNAARWSRISFWIYIYFACDCSNMRSSLWLVASQQA